LGGGLGVFGLEGAGDFVGGAGDVLRGLEGVGVLDDGGGIEVEREWPGR